MLADHQTTRNFDVRLLIEVPRTEIADPPIEEALSGAKVEYEVEFVDEAHLAIWAKKVPAKGNAAMLEALRSTQAGLSGLLRAAYPYYAQRGGLFWLDVVKADAFALD